MGKKPEWKKFVNDLQAIHKAIQHNIVEEVSKSQLTGPQLLTLNELADADGVTVKELGGKLKLTHSTVSGIIDRLEKQGLVERQTDQADRRYTRIYLTEQVKDYVEKLIPDYYVSLLDKVKAASEDEQLAIAEGISKLRHLIDQNP